MASSAVPARHEQPLPPASLTRTAQRAVRYVQESNAPATLRGRQSDWRGFTAWCREHDLRAMPAHADTVGLYITAMAERGCRPATIGRHLSTISVMHANAGHESPTKSEAVRRCWKGIRRSLGVAPRPKAPLSTDEVRRMVGALPDLLLGVRDRAPPPTRVRVWFPSVRARRP